MTGQRIYDENGNHVLTIIPCLDNCSGAIDIATPDGKVVGCFSRKNKPDSIVPIELISSFLPDFEV